MKVIHAHDSRYGKYLKVERRKTSSVRLKNPS